MLPHQRVSFTFLNNLILDGWTFFEAYTVPVGKHLSRREEVSSPPSRTPLHHGKRENVGLLNYVAPERRSPGDNEDDVQVLQVLDLL